jgi:hypothetical protein
MLFGTRFNSGLVFFAIVISHSARILGRLPHLTPLTQSLMTFGRGFSYRTVRHCQLRSRR